MSITTYNGSAVIGMKGKDCVAIATDLRFGVGYQTIATNYPKVEQLGPHLFVGFPGLVTDKETVCQRLVFHKNMYELRENRHIRPKTLLCMLANLLYERRFGPYFVEPVVVGIDPVTNEPFIGGMDVIGYAMETDEFVVAGSCTEQLYGMCETLWEKDMDPCALFECISQCVLNAMNRDCISGWGARVYLIEKDRVTITDLKGRMD
ncbi:Proteasome subunit beta type-3 [Echinococcus granulosus]|uniref:Proteasome subunit beta n=2 Tax=Echinococcus granulosus TaxID=6210 RepID=A0A068WDQ4_ECHGR|nr:Proteasome subunit beta type-3 [Echinococcus granulosus]CDS17870.1 proteasome subunit beta t family [Echinococcus granulosus]